MQTKGEKFVEENYDKSIEELTWHLIKEQLVKAYGIKVEKEDLIATAKNITKIQFAQYGMINVPEEMLDNYANEMLKKQRPGRVFGKPQRGEQVVGRIEECREVEPQRNQRRGFQQVVRLIRAGQV